MYLYGYLLMIWITAVMLNYNAMFYTDSSTRGDIILLTLFSFVWPLLLVMLFFIVADDITAEWRYLIKKWLNTPVK